MDQQIIIRFLSGVASTEEIRLLKEWVNESEQHRKELARQKQIWILSGSRNEEEVPYLNDDLLSVMKRIRPGRKKSTPKWTVWLWRAAAILAVPVSILSTLYFVNRTESDVPVAYNVIQVPNSQRSNLYLSDGSRVRLNSGSSLRYPGTFHGEVREVYLEGEAYFEINEEADKPFLVHTSGLDVRVTGTEFNVSAYPEDQTITTTLVSGAVQVFMQGKSKERVDLQPNDQLIYQKTTHASATSKVNATMYTSWTSGEYIFQNQELGTILKTIERWYDIQIVIEDTDILRNRLSGRFRDDEPLEQVMEVIRITTPVEFRIEEKKVFISQKNE